MSYYGEEFYNEPSEFDQQIYEFKESILKSVKDEFLSEMEKLRTENTELQAIKKDWRNIQSEYETKYRQLEYERKDMEKKISKKRLNDLMEDFKIILYTARSTRLLPEKCNKCNEKRQISYMTPSGREAFESCECSSGKVVYYPEEFVCYELYLNRNNMISGIYKERNYSDDGLRSSGISSDDVYQDGTDYDKLNYYSTMFRSKEKCQEYCDWLTEQKATK